MGPKTNDSLQVIFISQRLHVEPSLQAAFVEYGGNRHGFLAFSEIHPDYYQIPVADREALMAEEEAYADAQRELENSDDDEKPKRRALSRRGHAQSTNSKDAIERQEVVESDTTGMETIDLDDQETETLFDDDKAAQAVELAEMESGAAVEMIARLVQIRRRGVYNPLKKILQLILLLPMVQETLTIRK